MLNFIKKYFIKYKSLKKFPKFIITTVFSCLLVSSLIFGWAMIEVIKNPDDYTTTNSSEELLETLNNEYLSNIETLTSDDNGLEITLNTATDITNSYHNKQPSGSLVSTAKIDLSDIPTFNNKPYVAINNNQPYFDADDFNCESFEYYSSLDSQGRCGVVYACIGTELMPTEERGEIGQIKPTGWHTIKYDVVDGKYLYNRCHLIGWQLTGENSNERNLITGTRYMNVQSMLPFENMVADYIKETNNHVLYRVTPIFEEDYLLANGVQIEAYSVEDNGEGICFNVFCYNAQPGIAIDYSTGKSRLIDNSVTSTAKKQEVITENIPTTEIFYESSSVVDYVVNINTGKFHYYHCSSVDDIKPKNRMDYNGTREYLIGQGYVPCKRCNP